MPLRRLKAHFEQPNTHQLSAVKNAGESIINYFSCSYALFSSLWGVRIPQNQREKPAFTSAPSPKNYLSSGHIFNIKLFQGVPKMQQEFVMVLN